VPGQPGLNCRYVLIGGAELLAELIWCQPFVVACGTGRMQLANELPQGGFLVGAAGEHQMHAVKLQAFGSGSAVIPGIGQGMHGALERDKPTLVDRLDDARCRERSWLGDILGGEELAARRPKADCAGDGNDYRELATGEFAEEHMRHVTFQQFERSE